MSRTAIEIAVLEVGKEDGSSLLLDPGEGWARMWGGQREGYNQAKFPPWWVGGSLIEYKNH